MIRYVTSILSSWKTRDSSTGWQWHSDSEEVAFEKKAARRSTSRARAEVVPSPHLQRYFTKPERAKPQPQELHHDKMAHSKRNTSLAFFTTHERSQLKSSWGSQSTRLTRDSFLPFASCNLCLQPSRSPVACASSGDIFCRECAVGNLLAQRKEINRLEKEDERRRKGLEEEENGKVEEERKRSVLDFERTMMGLEGTNGGGGRKESEVGKEGNVNSEGRGVKRKVFELDEGEMLRGAREERAKARRAIDEEKVTILRFPFAIPNLHPHPYSVS
ncbi:MAG: hypothetical protein Q9184_001979 [Pyrenodesmia sp. 2 TL-2023]